MPQIIGDCRCGRILTEANATIQENSKADYTCLFCAFEGMIGEVTSDITLNPGDTDIKEKLEELFSKY